MSKTDNAVSSKTSGSDFFFNISILKNCRVWRHLGIYGHIRSAKNFSGDWLINMISISEGRSYLYTNMDWLKTKLRETIDLDVKDDFLITKKLWLRKELLKELSFF